MTARRFPLLLVGLVSVLLAAAPVLAGCGGDDDGDGTAKKTDSPAAGPLKFEDVKPRLEAAGYTVKTESPEPLIRRDDGGIVKPTGQLVVTGGDLSAGSEVSVAGLGTPEDVAAMQKFAGGGRSLVEGDVFFQATEPGEAETVAKAARG
jgi:hypothetical protein